MDSMKNRIYPILRLNGDRLLSRFCQQDMKKKKPLIRLYADKEFFMHTRKLPPFLLKLDDYKNSDGIVENAFLRQLAIEIFYLQEGGEPLKAHKEGNTKEESAIEKMKGFDEDKKAEKEENGKILKEISRSVVYVNFLENKEKEIACRASFLDLIASGFQIDFGDEVRSYHTFFKSSSMSKKGTVSFIDEKYYEALFSRLMVGYDCDKDKLKQFNFSQFFAYTGLALTDGTSFSGRREDLLSAEKIVVVKTDPIFSRQVPIYTRLDYDELKRMVKETLALRVYYARDKEIEAGSLGEPEYWKEIKDKFWNRRTGKFLPKKESDDLLRDLKSVFKAFDKDFVSNELTSLIIKYSNIATSNDLAPNSERVIEEAILLLNHGSISKEEFKKKLTEEKSVVLYNQRRGIDDIFDGEGLVSPSLAKEMRENFRLEKVNDSKKMSSFQIRLPFIKGMVHECDFASFFADHKDDFKIVMSYGDGVFKDYESLSKALNIGKEEEMSYRAILDKEGYKILDNFNIYRDISKIEMMLTVGQLKLKKFLKTFVSFEGPVYTMEDYFSRIRALGYTLIIANAHRITDSTLGKCKVNYQFVLTAGNWDEERLRKAMFGEGEITPESFCLNPVEEEEVLSDSSESDVEEEENEETDEAERMDVMPIEERNELDELYALNQDIRNTGLFRGKMEKYAYSRLTDYAFCKFSVKGERRYLSSDLLLLLYFAIGRADLYDESPSRLKCNEFYAPKTGKKADADLFLRKEEEPCVLLRNPHLTKNENVLAYPYIEKENDERSRYFASLTKVCMINVSSLSHTRLGGADFDGDEVVIVDDPIFNEGVYEQFERRDDGSFLFPDYEKELFPSLYPTVVIPAMVAKDSENDVTMFTDKEKWLNVGASKIARCFLDTFSNQIGKYNYAGNAASMLSDIFVDKDKDNLLHDPADYTIVVGLEIDKAKTGVPPKEPRLSHGHIDDYEIDKLLKAAKEITSSYRQKASYIKERKKVSAKKALEREEREQKEATRNKETILIRERCPFSRAIKLCEYEQDELRKGIYEGKRVKLVSLLKPALDHSEYDELKKANKEKLIDGTYEREKDILELLLAEFTSYQKASCKEENYEGDNDFESTMKAAIRLKEGPEWYPYYDELDRFGGDADEKDLNPSLLRDWGIKSTDEHLLLLEDFPNKKVVGDSISMGYRILPCFIHLYSKDPSRLYLSRSALWELNKETGLSEEELFAKRDELRKGEVDLIRKLFPSLYLLNCLKEKGKNLFYDGVASFRNYMVKGDEESLLKAYDELSSSSLTLKIDVSSKKEEFLKEARALRPSGWDTPSGQEFLRNAFPEWRIYEKKKGDSGNGGENEGAVNEAAKETKKAADGDDSKRVKKDLNYFFDKELSKSRKGYAGKFGSDKYNKALCRLGDIAKKFYEEGYEEKVYYLSKCLCDEGLISENTLYDVFRERVKNDLKKEVEEKEDA